MEMDVVVKAILHHWTYTELGLWKHFLNARGHDVRQRMALRFKFLVLRHTRILYVVSGRVERGVYWRKESKTAIPTIVAIVPVKAASSVNRMKLGRLFVWY